MEPFVYEKDFTRPPAPKAKRTRSLRQLLIDHGFSDRSYMKPREIPYVVDPEMKKNFEDLIPPCEALAKRWGGHIRATIDHDKHDAYIVVSGLRFFEFTMEEERQFLKKLADCSTGVTFLLDDDARSVKMSLYFPYYSPVISEEEEEQAREDLLTALDDIASLLSESQTDAAVQPEF